VLRIDLPFRQRRPKGPPPRGSGPADRAGLARAVAALRIVASGPLFLGGHSYGGRMATMLAADMPDVADALLLFSYPLHPPSQPDRPRTEHFPRLATRAVFVHGSADPFGTPDELSAALALIPARVARIEIAGAGHDLKRGRLVFAPVVAALLGDGGQ
jgi:predicted alpha/beta-hydrolase family hydrolase